MSDTRMNADVDTRRIRARIHVSHSRVQNPNRSLALLVALSTQPWVWTNAAANSARDRLTAEMSRVGWDDHSRTPESAPRVRPASILCGSVKSLICHVRPLASVRE